jgi:hypothetical protein
MDAERVVAAVDRDQISRVSGPAVGFGEKPTLIALFLYGLLPIFENTVTGLTTLPYPVLEAARGVGMTGWQRLVKIELPLALPVIIGGIRLSVVIRLATATIGSTVFKDTGRSHHRRATIQQPVLRTAGRSGRRCSGGTDLRCAFRDRAHGRETQRHERHVTTGVSHQGPTCTPFQKAILPVISFAAGLGSA